MVTRTGTHALQAVAILGTLGDGVYAGAAEIARGIRAPANYLGKLLQRLARAGLLVSRRGKAGGFRLARPPREITLFDILEPLERVSRIERCILGSRQCSGTCALHTRWGRIREAYLEFLHQTNLEPVVAAAEGRTAKEANHE